MELFFVEVITLVVSNHPNKIGNQNILLADVIELNNKDHVVEKACADYLNTLAYKKPSDNKKDFMNLISSDETLLAEEWLKFIEMKARRDLGVHNDWLINEIYIRKINEANFDLPADSKYMFPSTNNIIRCTDLANEMYGKVCQHLERTFC